MKRTWIKYGILTAALLSIGNAAAFAQSETDAVRYARTELGGSARFQSMAGAMGAVGSDYSSTLINPAGLALNQRPLNVSLSLEYDNIRTKSNWISSNDNITRNKFGIREFSISGMTPISYNSTLTYGFGYQRQSGYRQHIVANAMNPGASLADYAAAMINNMEHFGGLISNADLSGQNYDNGSIPWLSILAWEGGWINSNDKKGGVYYPRFVYPNENGENEIVLPQQAVMDMEQTGSNNRYDANMAFNIDDTYFIGLGIFTSSVSYTSFGHYTEYYLRDEQDGQQDYLGLDNYVDESGFGGGFSLGFIYAPIPELRLGVSYFTPTWYAMKRNFDAIASSRYGGTDAIVDEKGHVQKDLQNSTPAGYTTYDLKTPGHFNASAAAVIGNSAILSFDYEYTNLGHSKLSNDDNDYSHSNVYGEDNKAIKEDYGEQHTFRIGAEFRVTKRLSLRGGYMMKTDPVKNSRLNDYSGSQKQEVLVAGTTPAYLLQGKSQAITGGLGFRITPNWTADLAVVWQKHDSHLVTFPYINDFGSSLDPSANPKPAPDARMSQKPIEVSKDQINVLATISYRF